MKTKFLRSLFALIVVWGLFFERSALASPYAAGQALVLIRSDTGQLSAASLSSPAGKEYIHSVASRAGARVNTVYPALSEAKGAIFALMVSDTLSTEKLIENLNTNPQILAASPNYILKASRVPDDFYYSELWAMPTIRAEEAWENSTGDASVHIAVADSGIYKTHEDLAPNIDLTNSRNFTNGNNPTPNTDMNFDDADGHGTHVSGTIAAVGNNSIGVAGINWNSKVLTLKILGDNGSGYTSWMVASINYLIQLLKADPTLRVPALNLSLGYYSYSTPEEVQASDVGWAAFKALSDLNRTVIVVAAGNEALEVGKPAPYSHPKGIFSLGQYAYPASFVGISNMVVVGASTSSNYAASFSNWSSSRVHIIAPGDDILSTFSPLSDINNDGQPDSYLYATASGTSMAAPHISGAVGLLSAHHPSWSASDLKSALLSNARADINPIPPSTWNTQNQTLSMHGLLDIQAATESSLDSGDVTGIILTPQTASIPVNGNVRFSVAFIPPDAKDKRLTWSSNAPHIAEVDSEGTVTGKTEGTALITATALGGENITQTAQVTVTSNNDEIAGILLTPQTARIPVGESIRILATFIPSDAKDKRLTWSSQHPHIAVVDSEGQVTGKKEGITTITATALGGNNISQTAQVIVSKGGDNTVSSGSSGCNASYGSLFFLIVAAFGYTCLKKDKI